MAGLLDFLGSGSGGGLLDFLRSNAMNQQFSSGLPSDQAQYGSAPQMPSAFAQLQPNPAMMQPQQPPPVMQAQPMQAPQQYQPPSPQAQPQAPQMTAHQQSMPQPLQAHRPNPWLGNDDSFLNRIMGNDPGSIAAAQQQQTQNLTAKALLNAGVPQDQVMAAIQPGNTELLKTLITNNIKDRGKVRPATPEERKAAFNGNDTGQPLFMDAETGKPTFGPAQTNVNVNTEKTGQAELAKTAVEEYKNAQTSARESQKRLGMYDAFEKAAQGFTPGASAEMRLKAKQYLKDAGLIKGEDVPEGEIQQMIGRQLAIHAQPKGQGAVSNYERELYASALPSMTQSPEGLKQAIGINRKLEQFDSKVAEIWRNSARDNKGLPNYLDVQDKISALGSPLGEADLAAIQRREGGAAPAATGKTNIPQNLKDKYGLK